MFYYPLTEGAELRLLEERHAKALFALTDANRASLREWLPWIDQTLDAIDTLQFIRAGLKQFANNDGFHCGIWFRGEIAGVVSYHFWDWRNRRTSIGYWLGADFRGRGLMTAAVRALTDYALGELQLNRVEIRCATGNERSCKVPLRLGFTHEGVLKETEWLYDRFVDHHVYAMLREAWRNREISS
ncbi:GNAT family N-acetyltransferase [Numidum massiliense]|uniref:GNAT family N-acetyltransferase n=1 Tax=Numidum massiliense TaxID=1522315 RepID=UPI0006D546EC|nr:GNAT family protein [Numidum massiliense]